MTVRKRKDSAGSDDTASMIKGGGYLGARTRQPRKQLKRNERGSGGLCAIAPGPNPWLLLLVLYCSAYFVFMSADASLMECSFSLCVNSFCLMVIQIKVCQI